MFSLSALNVIGSSSLRLSRSFSSSTVNWFPKLKTHQGAKKRWKALSNSGFKRAHACHSHLNVCKSPNRKNHLAQTAMIDYTLDNMKLLAF
ncbi:50S ribosomal L35 [Pyrrhoderma noxium]|uniref:50S ribosomal protein L35 n=1 Tax=Pyrrhoderma noxium TaxID=2282107 RepID=A0A286UCF4_9AGAM|nr:50S ribosomal L35 [Pyrrhoderma noxium]